MSAIAAIVRQRKEKNPSLFCRVESCLWRVEPGATHCLRHAVTESEARTPA